MVFHGQAAACKPHITKYNAIRQMEVCKAHVHWSSGNMFCKLTNHASLFGSLDYIVPTVKFGRRGIMVCPYKKNKKTSS